jgi:hypothetical protein
MPYIPKLNELPIQSDSIDLYDDDVYLIKITTWQWVIKSISKLIRTSQNGISTK